MPKVIAPLTETAIRQSKPTGTGKPCRLFDGKQIGLHILIQPSGAKLWRLRYTFNGEERRMALGKYPELKLEEARVKAGKIKNQIQQGIDPTKPPTINTFENVAQLFVEWKSTVLNRASTTTRKYQECLKNDLLPVLGNKDIANIHAADVVPLLTSIEKRANSLAFKNQELISMIIKFAIQRGYRPPYTHLDLAGSFKRNPVKPKKIPAAADIPAIFKKIDVYPESVTSHAMKLQFLCFLRASETMGAEWSEICWQKKEWHIPASRMKMKRIHVVPLARQTINLLEELKKLTGETPYLFPSSYNQTGMCRDALSKAFRSIDLGIVPHGCRTLAGTWLRNAGYAPHLVETQLSHCESNAIAAAYQSEPHLLYLTERHHMMHAWADCLMPPDKV